MSLGNVDIEKVQKVYDSLAGTWDNKSHLIKQIVNGESNRTLELLKSLIRPGMKIADLGAGTGRATRNVLNISEDVMISSVDLSPKMLEVLERKVSEEFPNYKYLTTKSGDVSTISLPSSGDFDLVIMLYLLHHVDNTKKVLSHVSNMIKEGGRILVQVPGNEEFAAQIPGDEKSHYNDPMGRFSLGELLSVGEEAGLKAVETYTDDFDFIFDTPEDLKQFVKENSVLAKTAKYTDLNKNDSNFNDITSVHGQYITVLFEKNDAIKSSNNKNKEAYATWSKNYSTYALEKIKNRGYSYDELAELLYSETLDKKNTGNLLDVGAGIGLVDLRINANKPNVNIFGTDLSKDMMFQNVNIDNYDGFYLGDATTIPFADNYFDAIISSYMLHHSHSVDVLIRKIFNLLKEGGKVALVDFVIKDKTQFNQIVQSESREYGAVANHFTKNEMISFLGEAGFQNIKAQQLGADRDLPHVMFTASKSY